MKEARNLAATLRDVAACLESECSEEFPEGCTILGLALHAQNEAIRFIEWYYEEDSNA